jgi:hypothetical protein
VESGPLPAGGAKAKGLAVSDSYVKDPEAISRLTQEQYRVTQGYGDYLKLFETGSAS